MDKYYTKFIFIRLSVDYPYFEMAERKAAKGKEERVERKTSENYLNKVKIFTSGLEFISGFRMENRVWPLHMVFHLTEDLVVPRGKYNRKSDRKWLNILSRSTLRDTVYYDSDDEKDLIDLNLTSGQKFYRAVGHGLHSSKVHVSHTGS